MARSEELEKPAKNWQVESLDKRLDQQEKFNSRLEDKLDRIIQSQITTTQFEERILSATKTADERLENAVREIHLKYGPLSDNVKWLTRSVVLAFLAVVGQLVLLGVTFWSR